MKPIYLDHLPKMINKFKQDKGHELEVKRTWEEKKNPTINGLIVDEGINLQSGGNTHKIDYFHQTRVKGFREHGRL